VLPDRLRDAGDAGGAARKARPAGATSPRPVFVHPQADLLHERRAASAFPLHDPVTPAAYLVDEREACAAWRSNPLAAPVARPAHRPRRIRMTAPAPAYTAVRPNGTWRLRAPVAIACALVTANALAQDAAATKQRFDVMEYQVEGNTVLDTETIERAVYPYMGEGLDIDSVEAARAALERAYRDGGYGLVSVDIPPQKVAAGVVRLNVVQAKISRLRVVGARYYSQERILALVPGLAEGMVPNLVEVQQQLALVNSSPDERVTPLLRPGRAPGTTEVDLQVEDSLPLHGSADLNNAHAPNTSSLRANASLRYGNLFQRGHAIGLQVQTSPQDLNEVKVLVGTYSLPAWDGTLVLSAVKSDSASYVGAGVGVFGSGKVFGARWARPLPSERPQEFLQSLTLGVDYKDSTQTIALSDASSGSTGDDTPIHYLPFSINYGATTIDAHGSTEYGVGFEFAVRNLASRQAQFENKRYEAHSDFSLVKFNAARTQKLPRDMTLYVALEGQATGDPLVSNEQYVAGGEDSVRGYLESTQVGDLALKGTVELRTPNFGRPQSALEFWQFRTFFDAAYLRILSALPDANGHVRSSWQLSSYGLGMTLRGRSGLTMRGDLAWPLNSIGGQVALQARLQASAGYQF
jgi:hemolysin activation/secretion protein